MDRSCVWSHVSRRASTRRMYRQFEKPDARAERQVSRRLLHGAGYAMRSGDSPKTVTGPVNCGNASLESAS